MESTFQKSVKQVAKYPILLIVSGIVVLFCLIGFFSGVGNFFMMLEWNLDRIWYHLADPGYLFGNFFGFIQAILSLFSYLFYALQFLGVIALVALLLGVATGALELKKPYVIILLIAGIVAAYIFGPVEEVLGGFSLFASPVIFMIRLGNILPMNLAALVSVVALLVYYRKKQVKGFSLFLYIAGGVQILFALLHILGSIIYGLPFSFTTLTGWLLSLLSPVLFVFLGLMLEKRLTGSDAPYTGKVVEMVNGVSFTNKTAAAPQGQGMPNTAWQPQQTPAPQPSAAPQKTPPAPAVSEETAPKADENTEE